ncbi:MAG: hypothetical protein Q8Q29_03645 [Actinomycetota bacterium]|nr:hypothetical protein [Actinomycetota bacterium]
MDERVSYNVRFDILADGYLDAISKATAMLRTGVKVNGVVECEPSTPGWYSVVLSVWEDV